MYEPMKKYPKLFVSTPSRIPIFWTIMVITCQVTYFSINSLHIHNRLLQLIFIVIIIELRLNLGIRGLKIASRSNLESGPQLAEV